MSINLTKGENHALDKNTQTALIGLGWDAKSGSGDAFDLDASVIALSANGKIASDSDVIYFNNKKHSSGAIVHSGDNLTGAGDGDDETIKLDFSKMPANIERLVVVVNIYNAEQRKQNFGQVNNAYVRLVDTTGGKNEEQLRFDLLLFLWRAFQDKHKRHQCRHVRRQEQWLRLRGVIFSYS